MDKIKLPYGLLDDKLVSVEQVERGLKCNCICPNCKKPLIARKGSEKIHHFAHYNVTDCEKGIQTGIHIISKDFLKEALTFRTPFLYYPNSYYLIFDEQEIKIDEVLLENRYHSIVPDIIIKSKNKILLIEITYTHGIDYNKRMLIEKYKVPTIELDVWYLIRRLYRSKNYLLDDNRFKYELIHGTKNKSWVYNPKIQIIKNELKKNYCDQKEIKYYSHKERNSNFIECFNYTEDCPINKNTWKFGSKEGKSYANVFSNCSKCTFNLGINYKTIKTKKNYPYDIPISLYCCGYLQSDFQELIMTLAKRSR